MNTEISIASRVTALRDWYQHPLGRLLAETEQNALAAQLSNLFGYHLMVIDPPWEDCPLKDSRIPHHFIQSVAPATQPAAGLAGHTDDWPIMTDSVDAIILPHTLELSRDPHQVLREADRSLIPDGHLVILGFNPYGPWGLRRMFTPGHGSMPWDSHFLGLSRIKDWLGLLGFDTLESHYLFQRPPVQNMRLLEKLRLLETGSGHGRQLLSAAYILVARKRTTIITPVKPLRSRRSRLFPVGIPSSSQGNVRHVRRTRHY
ncbi:MAG: methyltransferase domain-containing protein [Gammaproteobacteria bacterium]